MDAPVELVSVIVGFGRITLAGALLGAGSHHALSGLWPSESHGDWPRGVQEGDAPRFAVEHAVALRPTPAVVAEYEELTGDDVRAHRPTLIEPHVRRVEPYR